ncbi:MAG: hypothetical protein DME26_03060, partial [Verrucomicrobia bacterium]
ALVVDDNATIRQILHHQIIGWKMRNGGAANGPDALAILRRAAEQGDPYRLAILDSQMAETDGLALARAIKADPAIAGTRLILLSSLGQRLDEATLNTIGVDACLAKPIKQSRLFASVVATLAKATGPVLRPTKPAAQSAASLSALPRAQMHKARILLAEDNSINQKVALSQLQKLGYTADAVANGAEVLVALEHIAYDIILMDCQMPKLDGYETTRQIRKREKHREQLSPPRAPVHIIAITANAMKGDRERCLAAGMNEYVSKPVQVEELRTALEHWQAAAIAMAGETAASDRSSQETERRSPTRHETRDLSERAGSERGHKAVEAAQEPSALPLTSFLSPSGGEERGEGAAGVKIPVRHQPPREAPDNLLAAVSPGSGCDHDESPVDQERLQELRGDDPDQLRELIDLYLAQAEELIGALGAAIETSSAREIERLAHKFVGSSVTCGMTA